MNTEMNTLGVKRGSSAPLGATVYPGGVNFSVFSKNASSVELLLFDDANAAEPDWGEHSHSIAFTVFGGLTGFLIHGMLNAYWEPLIFQLPPAADGRDPWRRWIDTALPSPHDICRWDEAELVPRPTYAVQPRSVALLVQHA